MLVVRNQNFQVIETLALEIASVKKSSIQQLIDRILAFISSGHWRVDSRLSELATCAAHLKNIFEAIPLNSPDFQVQFYSLWTELKRAEKQVSELTATEPSKRELHILKEDLDSIGQKIIQIGQMVLYNKNNRQKNGTGIDLKPPLRPLASLTYHLQTPTSKKDANSNSASSSHASTTKHCYIEEIDSSPITTTLPYSKERPTIQSIAQEKLNIIKLTPQNSHSLVNKNNKKPETTKKTPEEQELIQEYLKQRGKNKNPDELVKGFLSWLKTNPHAQEVISKHTGGPQLITAPIKKNDQKPESSTAKKPEETVDLSPEYTIYCIEDELSKVFKFYKKYKQQQNEAIDANPIETSDEELEVTETAKNNDFFTSTESTKENEKVKNFLQWTQINANHVVAQGVSQLDSDDLQRLTFSEATRAIRSNLLSDNESDNEDEIDTPSFFERRNPHNRESKGFEIEDSPPQTPTISSPNSDEDLKAIWMDDEEGNDDEGDNREFFFNQMKQKTKSPLLLG